MAIITLSRELGSRGTEMARMLSSRLGYAQLDKESLEVLLGELGMTPPQFELDDEKRPAFWVQFTLEKIRYLDFMKAAMYRFAADKDCVIIGRGGNVIFRGVPGTLRLRVIAPPGARVARLRERLGIDEQHALRMIHQSDHDRAGYHKYFFNMAWDSSTDYDLVINTATISPEEACDAVSAIVHSPTSTEAGLRARRTLADLRIAEDVTIAIVYRERIPVMSLDVSCDEGVITLHGMVRSQGFADRCVGVSGTVEGVRNVISYIEVAQYTYYPGV